MRLKAAGRALPAPQRARLPVSAGSLPPPSQREPGPGVPRPPQRGCAGRGEISAPSPAGAAREGAWPGVVSICPGEVGGK